jgi:hypothetical protein
MGALPGEGERPVREDDTVWIPAVPLPYLGWRRVRCASCGERFRGPRLSRTATALAHALAAYELHWRRVHEVHPSKQPPDEEQVLMGVLRAEARRIYAQVDGA